MASSSPLRGRWRFYLSFLLLQQATSIERVRIDPHSGNFIGKDGRTRVFHGVNIVQKRFPWHPSRGAFNPLHSLNDEDMADLKSWGFNVVRLGVMWPGVEPSNGQYNSTYLKVMREIVDDLYSHGIYTVVDFHQDCFSEKWCGEGLPAWLLPELGQLKSSCKQSYVSKFAKIIGQCKTMADFNISIDPATGFPNTQECLKVTFDHYSRTPELVSAWGNFYAQEVVQQKFQGFWRKVASTFADAPGVLGYDLINEPLNGDYFEDFSRIEPGYVDRYVLQPMYQALHKVIRAVDPNAILMYEPTPFPDTYPSNIPVLDGVHSTGFTSGPAGTDFAHQALSYHVYSCGFADTECDRTGDPKSKDCPLCDQYAADAVSKREADRKRVGGGVFLTEFGACSGSDKCIAELNRVLNQADNALHSWAYWQFKYNHDITTVSGPMEGFYLTGGKLQEAKVTALSRTYAPVVSGIPRQMNYDQTTGAFRLRYDTEQPTVHLATEVFFNQERNYKTGHIVSLMNANFTPNGLNRLDILAPTANLQVDVAIVRPYAGVRFGTYRSSDNDIIKWEVIDSEDQPGFELTSMKNITWWKALIVDNDNGEQQCSLSTENGAHGPLLCNLGHEHKHGFLFDYRIQIWKATFLGKPTHVDTIHSSYFGPLLNKRIRFTWVADSDAMKDSEEIVV